MKQNLSFIAGKTIKVKAAKVKMYQNILKCFSVFPEQSYIVEFQAKIIKKVHA